MGDRVIVTIKNSGVCLYGHWCGYGAPDIIRGAIERGTLRKGDESYAMARLIGAFHEETGTDSSTGIGVWPCVKGQEMEIETHGDAGVIVIDGDTFEMACYGGYLNSDGSRDTD